MEAATIRISPATRNTLRVLSRQEGRPMQSVLERVVEEYRRKQILLQANAEHAALLQDPQAAQDWQEEMALWEGALADGLEPEE